MASSKRSELRRTTTKGENDNSLDEDDDEPPEQSKKPKVKIVVPIREPEEVIEPDSKIKGFLHYFKIYMVLALWAVFTILLMIKEEDRRDAKLITILPETEKVYELPNIMVNHIIGVDITGPFVASTTTPANATYLTLQFQRAYYGDDKQLKETRNVSEPWKLLLVPLETSTNFDLIKPISKTKILKLKTTAADDDKSKSEFRLIMVSNVKAAVTVKMSINSKPIDKNLGTIYGSLILVFLYIMIIWEIINRTIASIVAATLAIGVLAGLGSRPTLTNIVSWVDMETILLLFGMMILVGILSDSGIFDFFAVYAYKISKGHIWPLINSLCAFTAVLSAFLDSATMMLLIAPIIIKLCEATSLDPVWVLMFLVLNANIGAACTPVGDPPNIIITTNHYVIAHNVNFGNFMAHTIPCILLVLIQTYIQLRIRFRKVSDLQFKSDEEENEADLLRRIHMWEHAASAVNAYSEDEELVRDVLQKKANQLRHKLKEINNKKIIVTDYEETLSKLKGSYGIRSKTLLIKSIIAFAFVVIVFFLHSVKDLHYLSMGWTAVIGAILLLILADIHDIEAVLTRIEWSTLIFFASLFILMEALSLMGLIEAVGDFVLNIVLRISAKYRLMAALMIILWVTGITSAFLDNIPVTAMMIRIVISLAENEELDLPLHPMVWALALGACFGGNGTLIGASANVVASGVANQHGYKFTFMRYFKIGFPVMIGNIIVTSVYILVAHCVFEWHNKSDEKY